MEQEPLPTFCVLGNILQISHELLANICSQALAYNNYGYICMISPAIIIYGLDQSNFKFHAYHSYQILANNFVKKT